MKKAASARGLQVHEGIARDPARLVGRRERRPDVRHDDEKRSGPAAGTASRGPRAVEGGAARLLSQAASSDRQCSVAIREGTC
eukprot:5990930-Heterocapsa_arctica.AAC.1